MQGLNKVVALCAMALLLPLFVVAQTTAEGTAAGQTAAGAGALGASATQALQGAGTPQTTTQQPSTTQPQQVAPGTTVQEAPAEQTASAPLRVMVGKSLLITTTDRLRRVSVSNPEIAEAMVVTPNQVLVHGRNAGEVSLLLWDERERSRSFDLRVDVDITAVTQEIKRLFPNSPITVEASRSAVVLSGHVATKEDAERAAAIASAYSPRVVNVLTFGAQGSQSVILEVKFAEVNRTAASQLGVNLFSTGAGNQIGMSTTGQFGGFGPQNITDTFPRAGRPWQATSSMSINDVMNVFLWRPDIHLGAVIRALQQKNVLQLLAEPNLIAVNGKEASFLAGGEFPFPVVQPGGIGNAVTIQFREFGVRLRFTPTIMPNGNIHLRVMPEVSALDFANALTISGFTIPALTTRRAETELELQDGQSFVIAGMMDNRVQRLTSKVPGLGDIPILGLLFKSRNFQKSNSELMVVVTARRVQPVNAMPTLPCMPEKLLERDCPANNVPESQSTTSATAAPNSGGSH